MHSYPLPFNEDVRQAVVDKLDWLEPDKEPLLDEIVELVRQHFEVPTALISILDKDKQRNVARANFSKEEISRDDSICAHAIMQPEPLVIADALADPRFRSHPAVANSPHVRFYLGAPIILSRGVRIGTLCAFDYVQRSHPSSADVALMTQLARVIAHTIERLAPSPPEADTGVNEAEKMRENLVTLIGHELRTPLTSILGFNRVLASRLEGQEARMADAAVSAATHLAELVDRALLVANLKSGDVGLSEASVLLDHFVDDVIAINEPLFTQAGKTLRLKLETGPLTITVDAPHFKAALSCLLVNASVHGGKSTVLTTRTTASGGLAVEIADDGPGFERLGEVHPRPFDVGTELDTRAVGGLGLGLPLTQRLVELHGGELRLFSSRAGVRATIILPEWRVLEARQVRMKKSHGSQ